MNHLNCSFISIQQGDTLETLAFKYNTSKELLQTMNPSIDFNQLSIGQKLCVPQIVTCPIGSVPYEIKEGDTIALIANKFYTTVETILSANPNINPDNLQVGQIVCITEQLPKVPTCPSMNIYVINKGDTFYSIAKKFGITLDELTKINPTIDINNLSIGTIICLPFTPTPYIIVIQTARREMNVYYLGRLFKTYQVAVGKPTTPSPIGQFYILNKQVNPGGPFGTRWMGLSEPHYGIHGTNRPDSIGTAASNGCVRMHNYDVEDLFSKVSVNTPVVIME